MFGRAALGRNFAKLWAALSVSLIGTEITALALPLYAVLALGASPLQMGALAAAGQVPYLLLSLPAGVILDRRKRRPVLIAADISAALLLLSIPLATIFGGPGYFQLLVVAFGVGACAVFSEVAHYAYVPTLLGRGRLTEGNSRLQVSYSVGESAGPGLAGVLIQVLSAPFAVLVNALTFLVSALLLRSIRHREEQPTASSSRGQFGKQLAHGLRMLFKHRLLRPLILAGLITAFFENGLLALYLLFATRELELNAVTIGLIFGLGGVGAIIGATLTTKAGKRFGVGRVITFGLFITALTSLVVPLATGPVLVAVLILAAAKVFGSLAFTIVNIHQWSLRQAVTPDSLAGRVNASQRFIVYGGGSIGALFGGVLGTAIGIRPAMLVCAIGFSLAPLWILFSPLFPLREQPTTADEQLADVPT